MAVRSIQRRHFFLFLLAGLAGALGFPGGPKPGRAAPVPESGLSRRSIETAAEQLFLDPDSARAVGRRYLECFPDQANPALLLENSGLAVNRNQPPGGGALSRAAINRRRQRDFLAGNTVVLGGWILARSEASLCALLALR